MENENIDVIEQLKTAIAEIIEYQKHLAEEITSIKTDLMDNIINPIKTEFDKYQHDEALSDFRCKHAEKLDGFNDKLRIIEHNPDFDIVEKAFDSYNEREDGMDEDEYVEKLAEHIQNQLDEIAGVFGVEKEDIEEVKVETTEGEVEAKIEDGKVVETEVEGEEKTETEIEGKEEAATDETEKEVEEEATADVEVKERPEGATDTPDDEEENYKYWEEQLKK